MISIIVPTYNAEQTIGKCLESLLSQEYHGEKEIIVVDDGSTDNTKSVVSRFKVLLLEQSHRGPAAARNLGASKARGDTILFMDADCIADKSWVMEMAEPFKNNEIQGVQGIYKTNQMELIARFAQLEIENRYDKMRSNLYIDFIGSYSAAYRKETFLKNRGFYEGFSAASGEDPDLSFRLSDQGLKLVLNTKAVIYHQHPNTLSRYLKQKFNRAYWRVLLYKRHKSKAVSESYTPQVLKLQILFFYLTILSLFLSATLSSAAFLLLLLSTLPESYKNFKKDRTVGLFSPVILISRTIVFSLGLVLGTLRNLK